MPGLSLPDGRVPVLLTAHDEDLIGQDAAAILGYLDREPSVAAVASTLLRLRRVRRHRALVRAADRAELAAGLSALINGDEHPLVARSSETAAPRTAFVFPGQGNQWPSMGADAYRQLPAYRAEADRCAQAFGAAGMPSPLPYLVGEIGQQWSQIHIQGAQFTHAVSLGQVWRSCGVLPDITVGHSLGEVAAAYVAGTVDLHDAVAVVGARANVVDKLPGRYGMAVLGAGVIEAKRLIAKATGWLEVSAVNAPSSTVVSGDHDAVAVIVRLAQQRGIFARELAVDYPGHTSALERLRDTLKDLLPTSVFLDAPVEFVGAASGASVSTATDFTEYWYDNLRNTVRFDRAVATAMHRGAGTFVELSAHPSLLYALVELTGDALIVGSGRRDEPITDQLSANIAAIAAADPGYRWADGAGVGDCRPLWGFPNAPMRTLHLWATPEPLIDDPRQPWSIPAVAFEEWEPRAQPTPSAVTGTPCGIAVVGSDCPETPLMRMLTEAVAARHDCRLTRPDEAEIVVIVAPTAAHPDPRVAAEEIARGARLPDYGAVVGPRCRSVWLLTAGGEQVGPGDPSEIPVLPAQAALAAMHRSVGFEFPDQTFGHLDLPCRDIDSATAFAAVDVLLGDAAEIALRPHGSGGSGNPVRYTRTLRERHGPAPERPLDVATLDNVVITGGNGAIGRRFARHCVEHGARRIILLSRNGVDLESLGRLTDGHPVEMHGPVCDITDPGALSEVAAEYAGDGASLLIHAAGVARFAPHDRLTGTDLAAVFGAKVGGLAHIADIWPLRHGVRILVCSSVSGVWGGHGHAAYAGANRMLDALAHQLRARGLDCTAVRWGLWRGTGIVDADEIARIERSGLLAMDPDAALHTSLRRYDGDPLILDADFDRLRVFFESQGIPLPFAVPADAGATEVAAERDSTGERPYAEVIRAELAATLSLDDPGAVDLNSALIDLGVDSLLALDLRKRLRRSVGTSVPLASLLGGITGAELIDALRPGAPRADHNVVPPAPRFVDRAERLETSRD